jgi:very-short-patch-repair endonuclease
VKPNNKKHPHPTPLPHAGEGSAGKASAGEGHFYRPFKKNPVKFARLLRRNMTDVERKLWKCLRSRQFEHLKFRRQYPIGNYIVDFICVEKNLIVELDGGQHCENKKDAMRDAWLKSQGYRLLRFWNNEVLENLEGVLQTILQAATNPHPNLLPGREKE